MAQETRVFDGYGPKLQIETGNPVMGTPGRSAFSIMSTTDSNVKFVQAHCESGLTKFDAQGTMQFEAGAHPTMPSGITAFKFDAHKGDFSINAEKGLVRISGKQIVLDASREIVIQSPKIRIGYENANKTKDVKIIGQEVDIQTKKGSLANVLMTSSFLKTFDGSLIADIALDKSGGPVSSVVRSLITGASNLFKLKF